jgi:hypothetical protein
MKSGRFAGRRFKTATAYLRALREEDDETQAPSNGVVLRVLDTYDVLREEGIPREKAANIIERLGLERTL